MPMVPLMRKAPRATRGRLPRFSRPRRYVSACRLLVAPHEVFPHVSSSVAPGQMLPHVASYVPHRMVWSFTCPPRLYVPHRIDWSFMCTPQLPQTTVSMCASCLLSFSTCVQVEILGCTTMATPTARE